MTTQEKNYHNKVEQFVLKTYEKFWQRTEVREPISKILPKYWDDIFLRCVKDVMFERRKFKNLGREYYVWVLRNPGLKPGAIASAIVVKERALRKFVWKKNDWGNPYHATENPKPKFKFFYGTTMDTDIFFATHWDLLKSFIPDEYKRMELMQAVQEIAEDRFHDGLVSGALTYRDKTQKENIDSLVDIYNNVEMELEKLKKIIDNE